MEIKKENLKNNNCTIIILSFNEKDVTDTCLEKTEIAARYSKKMLGNEIEIVVVDNGSRDGSCEMIEDKHPGVKLVSLPENVGYPRGNNLAMKEADTPYILLLNNDSYLKEETVKNALEYIEKKPSCDALCVKLTYPDGSFQPYGGNLPTPWRTLCWTFGIESLPLIKHLVRPIYQYTPSFFDKEQEMEWCTTGFFLMKKKIYDATKGFDERLFLYMEDVEWCKRMKESHFKICYTPSIDIVHLGGFTCKKMSKGTLLQRHVEGMLHFHKVHYPGTFGIISRCLLAGMMLRAFFYVIIRQPEKANAYREVLKKNRHAGLLPNA